MRRIVLFITLVIFLTVSTGCRQQPTKSVIVKKGSWAAPIPISGDLYPLGEGEHAWVWSYDPPGLYLVDRNGELLNKGKRLFDNISGRDGALFVAKDAKHAWAKIAQGSGEAIYLVDTDGTTNLIASFEPSLVNTLYPFADGTVAIAQLHHEAKPPAQSGSSIEFVLLKADGSKLPLDISAPESYRDSELISTVDSEYGWLIFSSYQTIESIYVVNGDGKIDNLVKHIPEAPKIQGWDSTDDGNRIWIEPERAGLFVFTPGLPLTGQSIAAFANEKVERVLPVSNTSGWVLTTEHKLYFIQDAINGAPIEMKLPKIDGIPTLTPDGNAAWVIADGNVYFVESNGNIVRGETDGIFIGPPGPPAVFPVGNGQQAFLVGADKEENTLFLISARGKLIKKQKSFRNNRNLREVPTGTDLQSSEDGTTLYATTPFGLYAYEASPNVTDEGNPILSRIVNGNQYVIFGGGGGSKSFRSIYQAGKGKRIWAHSSKSVRAPSADVIEGANYIVGTAADVTEATVYLDSERLSLDSDSAGLRLDPRTVQSVHINSGGRDLNMQAE
jgi:hypothetical protein